MRWIYSPSYKVEPLLGYLALKKELETILQCERTVYFLFTHMDLLTEPEKLVLQQELNHYEISSADLIYTGKSCQKIETCDHWWPETLQNYRQFLANVDLSFD